MTPAAAPTVAPAPPPPPQDYCSNTSPDYTGDGSCRQRGEIVTVARVIDGDTLELADRRVVRLLGIDAPTRDHCAGAGATAFTSDLVSGRKVRLHQERGTDRDESGNLWRYVAYSNGTIDGLPVYSEDLGIKLVEAGWARTRSGGDNINYMRSLDTYADNAQYQAQGLYGPPCGRPNVRGDDNGNGTPDWDEDVDVDVDAPNVNLPDGALTGGFCARKWWC